MNWQVERRARRRAENVRAVVFILVLFWVLVGCLIWVA